jgi:PBSX family phage terminase large subunit
MARAPNEKLNKALSLYQKGYKLVDIAKELDIPVGTIRSWKNRYKWSCDEGNDESATLQKEKQNRCNVANDISWIEIESEYVTDIRKKPCSLEDLSKKYNIAIQTIYDYSASNEWSKKRRDYKEKTKRKVIEKSATIDAEMIMKYRMMHLNISDKVLNELNKALDNPNELYTVVEKLRQGYGSGEFSEKIETEVLDVINDSKVVNIVNALDKLQKMQRQTIGILDVKDDKDSGNTKEGVKYTGIPATMVAPAFAKVIFDIQAKEHLEYVFPGGRGSTKSSFIGLDIIDLLMKNENMHACVLRQVGDTLRSSVYQQVMWAISALGLEDEFHDTVSPLEITRKSTGQKIYFRGADDPDKIKSIKVPFGYIGIAWFEELDQFVGPEAVRKIEQSVIRGGDVAYIFKSFNPPKSANNWANKYIKIPKANRLVTHSTYLDVPKEWLGKPFLDEAEFLKEVNPDAYENEYMGVANGSGGSVFDNVTIREITDDEIKEFDRIYHGVDWGYYPDKYAYTKSYYDAGRRKLYIFDEYCCNKKSNKETYTELVENHGVTVNDLIICDSAEPKSVGDYKSYGLFARGAEKGPDSVNYSMKWLQSLNEIIIDNRRAPNCATEFMEYEYDRDKNGDVISGYPDKNNHCIDSVRYALNNIWKKRGQ